MIKFGTIALIILNFLFHSPAARSDVEVLTDVESGNIVQEVKWLRPEERVHLCALPLKGTINPVIELDTGIIEGELKFLRSPVEHVFWAGTYK